MAAQIDRGSQRRMLKNAGHLFLAQGVNYIFPLISLPYLTYTLGIKGFGIYAFTQVIIQYIQVVTDYGFNLTATRKLATVQNDQEKISEVFWSVLVVKIALGVIATIVGAILLPFFVTDGRMQLLYIYSFFAIWGSIFFPVWYFQGIESMQKIAWINMSSKIIGIGVLFLVVHNAEDIALAGLAQALPSVFSAILACWIIYKSKKISKIKIKWQEIKKELSDGRHIFFTSLFSTVLANSGVFVLGLYHKPEIVGIYAASERIVKAAVGCFAPITQAIYPNNAKAFANSQRSGFEAVKVTGMYVMLLALLAGLCLWLLAPYIAMIFHWQDERHIFVMRALVPWLLLSVINNIFGIQILTAMGAGSLYSRLFMLASTVSAFILITGGKKYNIIAVIASMNIAEAILTILLIVAVNKKWNLK